MKYVDREVVVAILAGRQKRRRDARRNSQVRLELGLIHYVCVRKGCCGRSKDEKRQRGRVEMVNGVVAGSEAATMTELPGDSGPPARHLMWWNNR